MNILNYACHDLSWQPQLKTKNRDETFSTILNTLCNDDFFTVNPALSKKGILQALIEREALRTTAVGNSIAFPHARLENLERPLFAIATLKNPVMFDEESVQIVCLILVPASDPSISLKIMAQFSRILLDDESRKKVLQAQDSKTLEVLFSEETNLDKPLVARDIMRMPRWSIQEETLVSECAKMMSNYRLRAIPVINKQKQVIGEITSELLFKYGLPDFFERLKSVSFVAEFDPFEKYFKDERNTRAGDIMNTNPRIVSPEHTIMELVFDLAIKQYNKIYIADENGKWIGTVSKGTILDNVINI